MEAIDTERNLFSRHSVGPLLVRNRVVMSPMTRSRAIGNVPNELVARYYAQRAEAGLIITEGTSPAPEGLGYARIPGLFNDEHVAAWRKVTTAVHDAGSRIFVQLMHTGRVSHPDNMPSGARVLAPSAIALEGTIHVDGKGELPYATPEEMSVADINNTIEQFGRSAKLAAQAGFDGVELHGANGYLIDQFFNTATNKRTDEWGGDSIDNRMRFAVAVARRVAAVWQAHRIGIRLSPYGAFNGTKSDDDNLEDMYEKFAGILAKLGFAYIHIVDHQSMGAPEVKPSIKEKIRKAFTGTLILSGGYDLQRANEDIQAGRADLIAFGRPFIANPRLVTRLRSGAPLAQPDPATFYTPGEQGYTDYPLE